jgi:cytochrome c5
VTKTDQHFMRQFSMVIAGLMAFTLGLILFAAHLHAQFYGEGGALADNKNAIAAERAKVFRAEAEATIRPLGGVYAGEAGLAAKAAAEAAALEEARRNVYLGGEINGEKIYGNVCTACHTAGVNGAPKLEKAAWAARMAQGMDTLISHAVNGYSSGKPGVGAMPARGGNQSINDEQIKATIEYMMGTMK